MCSNQRDESSYHSNLVVFFVENQGWKKNEELLICFGVELRSR